MCTVSLELLDIGLDDRGTSVFFENTILIFSYSNFELLLKNFDEIYRYAVGIYSRM